MTKLHERMWPDERIEPATVRIPGGRGSDRATAPDRLTFGIGVDSDITLRRPAQDLKSDQETFSEQYLLDHI